MLELLEIAAMYDCDDSDFAVRLDKFGISKDRSEDFLSMVFY